MRAQNIMHSITQTDYVAIKMPPDKLQKLLMDGSLCVADFCCLDRDSKQSVWQICLLNGAVKKTRKNTNQG